MAWSYGDWHEDMVALYDDDTDQMVCWLQKKGGVDSKALGLIRHAPELLDELKRSVILLATHTRLNAAVSRGYEIIFKADGRGE